MFARRLAAISADAQVFLLTLIINRHICGYWQSINHKKNPSRSSKIPKNETQKNTLLVPEKPMLLPDDDHLSPPQYPLLHHPLHPVLPNHHLPPRMPQREILPVPPVAILDFINKPSSTWQIHRQSPSLPWPLPTSYIPVAFHFHLQAITSLRLYCRMLSLHPRSTPHPDATKWLANCWI